MEIKPRGISPRYGPSWDHPMNRSTLGWIFNHMVTLSHLVKEEESQMNALMVTLRKESAKGVTCWELKSHLFKAMMLPTFTYGTKIWGRQLGRFSRRAWGCIWCPTSKCILRLLIIFCKPNLENFPYNYTLSTLLWAFNNGLPTYLPLG